jgi:hypothetical protein
LDDANQQSIQITVPNNPLTGQNLKVVRQFIKDNEHHLVVELSNGHTQLIPARWAGYDNSAAQPLQIELILFSSASLRALIRMVVNLKNQRQPEECNGCDTLDPTVDDFQPRDASADDLSVDRSAASADLQSSVARKERSNR